MTVLSVKNLSFAYPRWEDDRPFALKGISFDMEAGDLLAVLGPNGAGKSTLLRLLGGTLGPGSGEIRLGNDSLESLSAREVARRVAWVPQDLSTLFSMSVEDVVSLGRFCHGPLWGRRSIADRREIHRALEETDLTGLRHRPVDRLSGGERRRVLLARALAQEPHLLLLDEPTAHLDPRHQAELVAVIERLRRERRLAVIAILHDVNLAYGWCPRALLMDKGECRALGPTARVLSSEQLSATYGLEASVRPGDSGTAGFIQFHYSKK
ncbi:MAG TPA: ABC transporter ATP-binding protein [Elusimicrobiota bacterium]|nr:ABC transporter ATP-binding protein [Elusimicrobiota bacterium]